MPHYFFADHGVSTGPFTLDQISDAVNAGKISALTLMWRDGMADWAAAEHVLADTDLLPQWPPRRTFVAQDDVSISPAPAIAAFGRRVAAFLIDTLVLFAPLTMLILLPRAFLSGASALPVGALLAMCGLLLYYTVLQGRAAGASIGKRALDIRVVRDDGTALGDKVALARYALLVLFSVFLLPCLVPLFSRLRRGLHDMICGTVVIESRYANNMPLDFENIRVGGWDTLTWVMAGISFLVPLAIGVVATISIPAYQEYVVQSKVAIAIEQARDASDKVAAYRNQNGHWPLSSAEIGLANAADVADVATLHVDSHGTVGLLFTSDFVRGRALNIRIGEDGHRQCTTNLPRKYTDRACSRATLDPALASAQPTQQSDANNDTGRGFATRLLSSSAN